MHPAHYPLTKCYYSIILFQLSHKNMERYLALQYATIKSRFYKFSGNSFCKIIVQTLACTWCLVCFCAKYSILPAIQLSNHTGYCLPVIALLCLLLFKKIIILCVAVFLLSSIRTAIHKL